MSEKYCPSYLLICCNVNTLFFRYIVRLYLTLDTCKPSRECNEQIDPQMNIIGYMVPMFSDNTETNSMFMCVLSKTLEPLNQLHSFMDKFVHYIHGKVCGYQVFKFAQYV